MTHLQGSERAHYVQGMFARISGRYDVMNRLMTGGRDIAWRRDVIRLAKLGPDARLLDVATGTGDILIEALKQHPGVLACSSSTKLCRSWVGSSAGSATRTPICRSLSTNSSRPMN
jgi:ubiquinone/menaquinone biosynthesis C-methylase UbiE